MTTDNPTIDWSPIQDRFYRKLEMYSMSWTNIDLFMFVVAAAPYGGPIALMRDDKKMIKLQKQVNKPDIYIYNPAGTPTARIPLDQIRLVGMGWSEEEELVCLLEDGTVKVFDIQGEPLRTFTFGHEVKSDGVLECRFYGSGVVALTKKLVFYAITSLSDDLPQPKRLAEIPAMTAPPKAWTVIEPQHTISRGIEVLVAVGSTIFVVDAADAQDQLLSDGPFTSLAVSPNGKLLAMFADSGILWVVSTDFQRNFTEMNTKSKASPEQLAWCGLDSVVAYWPKVLLMVGPNGEWTKHNYEDTVFLVPEIDGIRIVGRDRHEFLQKVPSAVEDVFKVGSLHPGAKLYDAYCLYEQKSPKADEYIRTIKSQGLLAEAVDCCIEAAGHEYSQAFQRKLLQAASFGKGFLDYYESEKFVKMCQTLRVLNAIHYYEVGLPITYAEYLTVTPAGVVDRLILRRQHFLASRVCDYLKLPQDKVLINWACAKIKQPNEDPAYICRAVVEKLANVRGISYTEIAKVAFKHSGPELATMLLDYEPKAGEQVPLLMTMGQDDLALTKAIESGDTELVYFVIMRLRQKMENYDFLRFIQSKPAALDLFVTFAKQQDPSLLRDLYFTDDGKIEIAHLKIVEAYKEESIQSRFAILKEIRTSFAASKDPPFVAKAVAEQIELYEEQNKLQDMTKQAFFDLSVSDTIYKCLTTGQSKAASDIASHFKVPDRRFWWIKVRALSDTGAWTELEKFSKSKSKSPIGYEPFVEACIQKNYPSEAKKYIDRLQPEAKPKAFIRIGALAEAAEAAFQIKDEETLNTIRGLAKGKPQIVTMVDNFKAGLTKK